MLAEWRGFKGCSRNVQEGWELMEPDGCKAVAKLCCQKGQGSKEQTLGYLWEPKKPPVR